MSIAMASNAYGTEHQRRRAELLPAAYNTPCPRCGRLMLRGQDLDLGHSIDLALNPAAKGDRIEHADCNRAAGGRLGNHLRQMRPSRAW